MFNKIYQLIDNEVNETRIPTYELVLSVSHSLCDLGYVKNNLYNSLNGNLNMLQTNNHTRLGLQLWNVNHAKVTF